MLLFAFSISPSLLLYRFSRSSIHFLCFDSSFLCFHSSFLSLSVSLSLSLIASSISDIVLSFAQLIRMSQKRFQFVLTIFFARAFHFPRVLYAITILYGCCYCYVACIEFIIAIEFLSAVSQKLGEKKSSAYLSVFFSFEPIVLPLCRSTDAQYDGKFAIRRDQSNELGSSSCPAISETVYLPSRFTDLHISILLQSFLHQFRWKKKFEWARHASCQSVDCH